MIFDKSKTLCKLKQPIIISKENDRVHKAYNVNKSKVFHYKFDGDIICDSNIRKCDFLIENETKKDIYLIELKGSDLTHAISQIDSSINILKNKIVNYNIKIRIICHSRSHQINSNDVRKFKEKYKGKYVIKNKSFEENI